MANIATVVIDEASAGQTSALSALTGIFDQAQVSPFPSRPGWERGAIFVSILVIGLVLSLIYPHLGPALLAISSLTFLLGLTVLNFQLWSTYNLDISLVILWLLIVLIATVIPVVTFLAGLEMIGPTNAAMLSTLEPVVTVLLAAWLFQERLTPVALLGGGLILVAVVLLTRNELREVKPAEI